MTRQEIKRRKAILSKQHRIQEKALVKRNIRLLNLKQKRLEAKEAKDRPKLKATGRIRNRTLVQMACGTYEPALPADVLVTMIRSRHGLEAKVKKLLGVEELVSE